MLSQHNQRNGLRHPLLNYLGGKWLLAPWIISHMPPHECYIEPFGGAASILLCKPRAKTEVINDLADDIVNLYEVIRLPTSCRSLIRALRRTPYSRTEYFVAFKQMASDNPVERARKLIVRSAMGFHPKAIYGEKTTFHSCPTRSGAHTFLSYISNLGVIHRRFAGVAIECLPALDLIDRYDKPVATKSLFYCDPPYVSSTRTSDAKYQHEMDESGHEALLQRLNRINGMAMISGYPSDLYRDCLSKWRMVTRQHRVFSTGHSKPRLEALWLNPLAVDRLQRLPDATC